MKHNTIDKEQEILDALELQPWFVPERRLAANTAAARSLRSCSEVAAFYNHHYKDSPAVLWLVLQLEAAEQRLHASRPRRS